MSGSQRVRRWFCAWPSLVLAVACGSAGGGEPVVTPTPAAAAPDVGAAPNEGAELIGHPASELLVDGWIVDGVPTDDALSLESWRDKVVLVRFWTDTCPYCKATAPALVELDREFAARGLVVVGVYHPKPRPRGDAHDPAIMASVAEVARAWGMRFPIAIDEHWRTVDRWWLDAGGRAATSASFLIDKSGVIRWVHPGPEYHPGGPASHEQCRAAHAALRAAIANLLD